MPAEQKPISPNPTTSDGIVCPFCAHVRGKDAGGACPKCTMEDTVGTRRSTGERIGPWFVLQRKNPTAPGLRFSVLLTLARRGHVTGKSIVRGPTTGQLWRYAAEVKGLSRLFGVCWHCKAGVSPDATTCPRCKSAQDIPDDPDLFLESQPLLPMMRELPALGTALSEEGAAFSNAPIDDRVPARQPIRRDAPAQLPNSVQNLNSNRAVARDIVRPPSRASSGASNGFNDVEDLTRALTMQAAADNRPARRTNGRATSEPILSASELAAAFQLEASPPSFTRRVGHALWTVTKIIVVILLLVIIAGSVAGIAKPEWRIAAQERAKPWMTKANGWWSDMYARVAGSNEEDPSKSVAPLDADGHVIPASRLPNPTPIRIDAGKNDTTKVSEKPVDKPVDKTPVKLAGDNGLPKPTAVIDTSPSVVDGLGGQTSNATPTTKAGDAPKQKTESPKPVETPPVVVQAPKPEPKVETPKAETPPAESPKAKEMTLDQAIAQATELRNSALDAESRRDWRAAVLIYEQIATLPEDARPSDLKVKLAMAKERLAGQ